MYIHISNLFLSLFLLTFGNKKCTLKFQELIFGGEVYLLGISGFAYLQGSAAIIFLETYYSVKILEKQP